MNYVAETSLPYEHVKQKIYKVFFCLIDAYVWGFEYNQPQQSKEMLNEMENLIKAIAE